MSKNVTSTISPMPTVITSGATPTSPMVQTMPAVGGSAVQTQINSTAQINSLIREEESLLQALASQDAQLRQAQHKLRAIAGGVATSQLTGMFMESINDKIMLEQQVSMWEGKARESDRRYREAQKILEQQDASHRTEAGKVEMTRARLEQTLADNNQLRSQVSEREAQLARAKADNDNSMSQYQNIIVDLRARAATEHERVAELQARVKEAENDVKWYKERWDEAQKELGMGPVSIFDASKKGLTS